MKLRNRAIATAQGTDNDEHETRPSKRVRIQEPEGGPSVAQAQGSPSAPIRDPESGSRYAIIPVENDHYEPRNRVVALDVLQQDVIMDHKQADLPSSPPDTPPGLGRSLTDEEQARQQKLKLDQMVELINPRLVKCRRCKAEIKLSMKSLYDPQHWTRHKGRCLKKKDKDLELWPLRTKLPSVKARATSSATPPLTPDDGDEALSSDAAVKEESPPPRISENRPIPIILLPSSSGEGFQEYLRRSGRTLTWDLSRRLLQPWSSWTWQDLQAPRWDVRGSPLLDKAGLENLFHVLDLEDESFVPRLLPSAPVSQMTSD
ncbi:hypothetical protein OBBRIDRAFT_753135 [Obba rivulosa]|uniref:Uncharacterized protein n=1 Tax=Obba rivulosa TaxID=1052685 RepID=A0A8E2DKJ0_9APHY|nr:hypothetical protein OBBRIDRAFT_753135 [Obba rivulosa]